MNANPDRVPVLTLLAIMYVAALACYEVLGEPPAPSVPLANRTVDGDVVTLGDYRRLPYGDDTPVVMANDEGWYRAVELPRIIVACPGDRKIGWYDPEDLRSNGRVAQQVLSVEPR